MPSCVVKWCRSHSDARKEGDISFHRFPVNEIRNKWIAAVRLERGENSWMPTKNSIICSIHFDSEDLHKFNKKGHQMIKKTAVPVCTMISSKDDSAVLPPLVEENAVECMTPSGHIETGSESSPTATTSKESSLSVQKQHSDVKEKPMVYLNPVRTLHAERDCSRGVGRRRHKRKLTKCPRCQNEFDVEVSDEEEKPSKIMKIHDLEIVKAKPSCSTPINIPSSDLESTSTHYLEQKLRLKTSLADKRLSKIRTLQRKNKRLAAKNISLKNLVAALKKKGYGDA